MPTWLPLRAGRSGNSCDWYATCQPKGWGSQIWELEAASNAQAGRRGLANLLQAHE